MFPFGVRGSDSALSTWEPGAAGQQLTGSGQALRSAEMLTPSASQKSQSSHGQDRGGDDVRGGDVVSFKRSLSTSCSRFHYPASTPKIQHPFPLRGASGPEGPQTKAEPGGSRLQSRRKRSRVTHTPSGVGPAPGEAQGEGLWSPRTWGTKNHLAAAEDVGFREPEGGRATARGQSAGDVKGLPCSAPRGGEARPLVT